MSHVGYYSKKLGTLSLSSSSSKVTVSHDIFLTDHHLPTFQQSSYDSLNCLQTASKKQQFRVH